jgi:hypothetical protein
VPRGGPSINPRYLTALVKALTAAGCDIERVEVDNAGKIVLVTRQAGKSVSDDIDFDRELAELEARVES